MTTVASPLDSIAKLTADVSKAQSLSAVFDAALDGLRDAFNIDRASILLFDDDGVMRFKAWRGLSPEYRAAVEGHTPWSYGQPAPEPVVVADVHAEASLSGYGPVFEREDVAALAFFPLVSERGVIGKFMLYRREPGAFAGEQVQAANAIGYLLGFAVERMQRLDEVRLERQRVLFALDAASMGTWEWNLRTQQVRWSENLERIHGLPPGSFSGGFESYEREIHRDDRERVFASIQGALKENKLHDVEYRIVAPDGTMRWVHGRGRVEHDESGQPVRMTGVCMDISARRRVQAEEEALRSRLTTLTDGSLRLLTSLNAESVVNEVLALAERVIAADAYAVWQRRGDEWTVAGSRGLSATFVSARLDGARARFDQPIIATDLTTVEALSSRVEAYQLEGIQSLVGVPLAVRGQQSGSIVFYYRQRHQPSEGELHVAVALGYLAAAAIDNARLFAEAQRANRLKDEFLATLSHELRTPLNVIAGRARMLAAVDNAAQARESAAIIDRNSASLTALVDDLLDVSRMTIGHIRLERQVVDMTSVVNGALQSVQSAAEAKGVALEAVVDADARVVGDPMRLQQIAWNLLTNAVKFTPGAGRVTISARLADDRVILSVRDTGKGVSSDALPHVFDMFWQAEPLPARRQGGLGLGLSIVKKLAELHGGSVTAESDGPNTGATFSVMLPRARVSQTA